ncbi:MAG: endonuclease/exonuclease/phosphatase family protein [Sphaerochaetaceae bacterium]
MTVKTRSTAICVFTVVVMLSSGCVVLSNRLAVPKEIETIRVEKDGPSRSPDKGKTELTILSWNIGYAGMGKEADFFMDGGSQYRPQKSSLVYKNLDGIIDHLSRCDADIFLLQEVAKTSWITRNIDVYTTLKDAFFDRYWTYSDDLITRWVWWPLRIRMGNATVSVIEPTAAETRALALEPGYILGMFRKQYKMHIIRIADNWVIVNVHLSAFDSAETSVREQQLRQVLDFASSEYEKGNKVVIGGDWNLRLVETDFPHSTATEHLFWIRDLPEWARMPGWSWAADAQTPSVRTVHVPYTEGHNYTLVIDGFLISPNVELLSVHTDNLDFSFSDHQSVSITVR